jgi:hypothetical protein
LIDKEGNISIIEKRIFSNYEWINFICIIFYLF